MFDNDGFDCVDLAIALGFGEEIAQEEEIIQEIEKEQFREELKQNSDVNEMEDNKEELIPLNKNTTRKGPKFENWVKDIIVGAKTLNDPL